MTVNRNAFVWALCVAVLATCVYFLFSFYTSMGVDGHAKPAAPDVAGQYSSEHVGISFTYPDKYDLVSRHAGDGHVITLLPKGYVPPQNSEGPPAISVSELPNPQGLTLMQWVQGDSRSNWNLIVDERASTSTVVGGEPAIWYHYSGLYEVDSVAVAHGGKVYIFSGDWLDPSDEIRMEFNDLIKTVQFVK